MALRFTKIVMTLPLLLVACDKREEELHRKRMQEAEQMIQQSQQERQMEKIREEAEAREKAKEKAIQFINDQAKKVENSNREIKRSKETLIALQGVEWDAITFHEPAGKFITVAERRFRLEEMIKNLSTENVDILHEIGKQAKLHGIDSESWFIQIMDDLNTPYPLTCPPPSQEHVAILIDHARSVKNSMRGLPALPDNPQAASLVAEANIKRVAPQVKVFNDFCAKIALLLRCSTLTREPRGWT